MSKPLVYRKNRMFVIDENQLAPENRRVEVINGLYLAMFKQFQGADKSKQYQYMTNQAKMACINEFAEKWLKDRKYL